MTLRFILCTRKAESLISGGVHVDKFWLLIEISSIQSHKVINALHDYLVKGASRKEICDKYSVSNAYITRCMQRLVHIDRVVEQLSSYYK
ncbi:TPA: transcriptional regulator [Escherichia coli]|nr:transcriptional regulator [Escherichia coli]